MGVLGWAREGSYFCTTLARFTFEAVSREKPTVHILCDRGRTVHIGSDYLNQDVGARAPRLGSDNLNQSEPCDPSRKISEPEGFRGTPLRK